jgi:Zn-dependent M28 family amino/carboxypeptidase
LGSRNYVFKHFGVRDDINPLFFGNVQLGDLETGKDYEKISAYYNLDNGAGKIRGVYLQGNAAVAPIFRQWLAPFRETGANTLTLADTFGTDHLSFDAIGVPAFQFIQDPLEYDTRTHHSNQDNFDRIQADDLKQASIIMAAFVYQTAMMDEKLPRKPIK